MNRITIAFFLQNLNGGGAEKSVVNLSNCLTNYGFNIDIVLVNKSVIAYSDELDDRVNIIDLKKDRSLKSIFALKKYLEKNKPDVIMSSVTHTNIIMILVKLLLMKSTTKVVINQVNHLSSIVESNFKYSFFKIIIIKSIVSMYGLADGVISMSKGVELDLLQNGLKGDSTFIYNPVVTDKMLAKSKGSLEDYEGVTFIAIGRLVKQKNFHLLIDAFMLVRKKIKSRLLILGEGPLRGSLESKISNSSFKHDILLMGFVDNPYIYLKNADVFVLTSLWEGFGNVIVESLALGTQVVSTNCPSGPEEILENGKYGFLSSSYNKNEIADLMIKAVSNPINEKILEERGNYFSAEKAALEYKDFLLK